MRSPGRWCNFGIALLITAAALQSAFAQPPQSAPSPNGLPASLLKEGIDHFYNLEYDAAIADFARLREAEPRNPNWWNHLALSYFYKELYRAGALQGDLFDASNRFFRTANLKTDP